MEKLRNKIIRIVLFSVIGVFSLMSVVLYLMMRFYNIRQADLMTQVICENNGNIPDFQKDEEQRENYPAGYNEESPYRTRYFIVYLDKDGRVNYANTEYIAAVVEKDALEMAESVLESGRKVGFEKGYRYRVSFVGDAALYIVFLDYSESENTVRTFLMIMGIVFVSFFLLIAVVFAVCSKYVLKPFVENSKRQQQFITDASHELKTPLAIISANAEVLEYKNGKNEWTQAIRKEISHMGDLIGQLLVLSKLQEAEGIFNIEPVDFSRLVLDETEKFREVFTRKNCSLDISVQPDVCLSGNKEQLQQMVSILLDNAAKYTAENGKAAVGLSASGKNVNLKIFNTAEIEDKADYSKWFERFYRADSSHSSSTGGHGIGLSMAKRIVDCHSGSIWAEKKEDGILFSVSLPCSMRKR